MQITIKIVVNKFVKGLGKIVYEVFVINIYYIAYSFLWLAHKLTWPYEFFCKIAYKCCLQARLDHVNDMQWIKELIKEKKEILKNKNASTIL